MHVVSQTCSWSATATNLIRKLNCCFRNLSSWFWIRTCCSVILIDSQDSLKLHIPVKITPSLRSVNVWSRDEVCVPSWLVWSAAHALPWCAVSLTRLIISKAGGIRRSHSHLKDVLICTDLLKIVFLGTSPNYLNGFGLLLWPRVRQVNTVLLSSFFLCYCQALFCRSFVLWQISQILLLDWFVQEARTYSTLTKVFRVVIFFVLSAFMPLNFDTIVDAVMQPTVL